MSDVQANAVSKKSADTKKGDIRAIFPMPAVLQVVDALLYILLERAFLEILPPLPSQCWTGAVQHAQVRDVAFAAQKVMEKGLDNFAKTRLQRVT